MLRKKALALMTASTLAFGMAGAPVASAQQNGLVNVRVGNVNVLRNVGIGVAANVAAQICGVQVPVAVLATQVVQNNQPFGVCQVGPQNAQVPVVITP